MHRTAAHLQISMCALAILLWIAPASAGAPGPPYGAPDILVATVTKVSEEPATNGNPPLVDVEVLQVLRGKTKADHIRTLWNPPYHGHDTGSGEPPAGWTTTPMEKPKVHQKFILCGTITDSKEEPIFSLDGYGKRPFTPDDLAFIQAQIAKQDTPAKVPDTAPARPEGVPADWVLVKAGTAFTFWGPADLKEQKVQGEDSFVGKYTNPALTVEFDYGWYSGPYEADKYKLTDTTVDGRKAVLATSKDRLGLYVGNVDPNAKTPIKLSIDVSCKPADAKQAETLLRSIKFGQASPKGR